MSTQTAATQPAAAETTTTMMFFHAALQKLRQESSSSSSPPPPKPPPEGRANAAARPNTTISQNAKLKSYRMSVHATTGTATETNSNKNRENRRTSLTDAEKILLRSIAIAAVAVQEEEEAKGNAVENSNIPTLHVSRRISASEDDEGEDSNHNRNNFNQQKNNNNHQQLREARRRLSRSMQAAHSNLTPRERHFLHDLMRRVPHPDCLAQAAAVLENDRLYQQQQEQQHRFVVHQEQEQQEPETFPLKNEIPRKNEPTFQRELWTEYTSQLSIVHERETTHREEFDNKKKENGGLVEFFKNALEDSHRKNKESGLVKFFQEAFGGTRNGHNEKNNDETQQHDVDQRDDDDEGTAVTVTAAEVEEEIIPFHILGTSVDDSDASPHVLSPPLMDALRPFLPFSLQQDNYWLKYSLRRDGASIASLLHSVRGSARTLLAIETMEGDVFGSFTSSPWRANAVFYGSGEAFVWRLRQSRLTPCRTVDEQIALERNVQVYPWSGKNRNVQCVQHRQHLAVGGGFPDDDDDTNNDCGCTAAAAAAEKKNDFGFAFALTNDLSRGTSGPCVTFGNPTSLTPKDVFTVLNVEVWTLSPVDDLEQAEKIELSRQFVFDHGNFVRQ